MPCGCVEIVGDIAVVDLRGLAWAEFQCLGHDRVEEGSIVRYDEVGAWVFIEGSLENFLGLTD